MNANTLELNGLKMFSRRKSDDYTGRPQLCDSSNQLRHSRRPALISIKKGQPWRLEAFTEDTTIQCTITKTSHLEVCIGQDEVFHRVGESIASTIPSANLCSDLPVLFPYPRIYPGKIL